MVNIVKEKKHIFWLNFLETLDNNIETHKTHITAFNP